MSVVFDASLSLRQPTVTKFFSAAIEQRKLHHAYLFVGGTAADKWLVARQIAMYLNCTDTNKDTKGCCGIRDQQNENRCQSCKWILEGKHPQAWFELKDSEATTIVIPVERARQISQELARTSSYKRVVIVEDANQDVFHRPAANALLKTIEEPRGVCLFFFFARSQDQVLATVVSRCQTVPFQYSPDELIGPLALMREGKNDLTNRLLPHDKELVPLVSSLKERKFFDWTRSRFPQKRFLRSAEPVSHSEKAMQTFEALEFGKVLTDLIDDEHNMEAVIDSAILTELEIIGTIAVDEPSVSLYLDRLLNRAEDAKMHLRRYVTKRAAVDSFVIDWIELRSKTST